MIFYKFLLNLYLNIKYTSLLNKIYKDENLLYKFSQLFGVEFKKDWVGRIYTVINPNILNNELDVNTQIFEYGENGLTNKPYIEKYIMTKLNLIKSFIMANNLFDLLTYEIVELDKYDNYLIVLKPITFDDCKKWTKIFVITYLSFITILITLLNIL